MTKLRLNIRRNLTSEVLRKRRRWIKLINKSEDWDFIYLLEVEREKLSNLIDYFSVESNRIAVGDENSLKWMKIAYNLLNIIIDESWDNIKYINLRNSYRYSRLPKEIINSSILDINNPNEDNKRKYYLLESFKSDKVKFLYYKIRFQYTDNWWN